MRQLILIPLCAAFLPLAAARAQQPAKLTVEVRADLSKVAVNVVDTSTPPVVTPPIVVPPVPPVAGKWIPTPNDPYIPNFSLIADRIVGSGETLNITGNQSFTTLFGGPGSTIVIQPGAKLSVETLQVVGATFQILTGATLSFKDTTINSTTDPAAYGHGLIAIDSNVSAQGTPKTPFVRLSVEPSAGNTTLQFASAVDGWLVGDKLLLPDSTEFMQEYGVPYTWKGETAIITAISQDRKSVTVAALEFNHPGAYDGNGVLRFLPHVANLTRDTIIRSENAAGVRGHLFFTENSNVNINNVACLGMGRTKAGATDSTTFDAAGNPTHIGTNQIGRYAVHCHHLKQPPTINGCAIYCPMLNNPFRWGISVHDTDNGTITNNVAYNWSGWGIGTEEGNEKNNLFENNFVCRIGGTGAREDGGANGNGNEGACFWFAGADNRVRNNVACNPTTYLYTLFAHDNNVPVREWSGNEGYGGSQGLSIWNVGGAPIVQIATSTIKDQHMWHVSQPYQTTYFIAHFVYDGWVAIGTRERLANIPGPTGISFGDYLAADVTVVNADIQNLKVGVYVPPKAGDSTDTTGASSPGTFTIKNCYLRNQVNVWSQTAQASAGNLPPRKTIIDHVQFMRPSVPVNGPAYDIDLEFLPPGQGGRNQNCIQSDKYFVTAFNNVTGDDFRVYFNEQVGSFVVPQSQGEYTGCPEAGLTNIQSLAKYGCCISGEIAPQSAKTRSGIHGLVQ